MPFPVQSMQMIHSLKSTTNRLVEKIITLRTLEYQKRLLEREKVSNV